MTEYIISEETLASIRRTCYEAGKAGREVFTVRRPSTEIVRCGKCTMFDRCPMRRGDGSGFCWQGKRRNA